MEKQPPAPPKPDQVAELKQKRHDRHMDVLYYSGAAAIALGLGMLRIPLGLIAAGAFSILPPLLELAAGFIRGLRGPRIVPRSAQMVTRS